MLRDRKAALLRKANPEKKTINRIGIQASKKVGGAVARNRAKRVIREAYRKIDKEYGIKQGWLIVITPYSQAAELKMQDVFRDLRYCLGKLDMLLSADRALPADTKSEPRPADKAEGETGDSND